MTSDVTTPIVYDASKPTSGFIAEGSMFEDDVVWWGHLDHIDGEYFFSFRLVNI